MRFLVTGGAGFIGSALANRLHNQGHEVAVLDDLSNGDRDRLDPAIEFTQGDIDNIPLLWSLLYDVDSVYHLAARVSVAQSILHPRDYSRVNVGGTVSLMEAMRDTGRAARGVHIIRRDLRPSTAQTGQRERPAPTGLSLCRQQMGSRTVYPYHRRIMGLGNRCPAHL